MSDIQCSICKCVVGRHKLEDGRCKDQDRCLKMLNYKPEENDNYDNNILNSRYFSEYRTRTT